MTKEVTRKPKPKMGEGVSGLEALATPERSLDLLNDIENNEVHIELAPQHTAQQRQFSPNLLAAAPGTRDHRFDGLRGEDRIAAAVEIGGLANIGQDMGLDDETTLGEVERLRMGGADGISGMEENPEVRKDINQITDEFYDGHRFHVVRTIGHYTFGGHVVSGGGSVIADISTPGDNDEEFNAEFVRAVDDMLEKLHAPVSASGSGETEHSGLVAERLFRYWRTLGGSFDLDSVGPVTTIRARTGMGFLKLMLISMAGGFSAFAFMALAILVLGPHLPTLTN